MGFSRILIAILYSTAQCDVIKEVNDLLDHENYTDFTCLQEMSEKYMEDLFVEYPAIKPTDRADVITLKRSFVKYLNLDPKELQLQIIAGSKKVLPEDKILFRFIKELKKIAEDEFVDLNDKELSYLDYSVVEYVSHKLTMKPLGKYLKEKKEGFMKSNMSKEEFTADVMRKCGSISHKWNMDPTYSVKEEVLNTPEIAEAFRKFEEKGGKDEMFTIHVDHQTKEKNYKTMAFRLLLLSLLFSIANCNVIDEVMEWVAHEEYFEFTCLQEKAEDTLEEFFALYPTLKPSDRADVIELKRSFFKFMDLDPVELQTELIAVSSKRHTFLARFIDDLKDLVREEYSNLTAEDKSYLENFDAFVQHKLILQPGLKDIKQKKAEFIESGLSKAEFAADVMRKCSSISLRWEMDPSTEAVEEAMKSAEFDEAFRKWEEDAKDGGDEILSIHIDGQTKEKKFNTLKKEL